MKRVVVIFAVLFLIFPALPVPVCAQSDSMVHVKAFPGITVGQKVTNAMATCPAAPVPCILVIDASLAAAAPGTMPILCATCSVADYRNGASGAIAAGTPMPSGANNFWCVGDSLCYGPDWPGLESYFSQDSGLTLQGGALPGAQVTQNATQMNAYAGTSYQQISVTGGVIPAYSSGNPTCTVSITYANAGYESAYLTAGYLPGSTGQPMDFLGLTGYAVNGYLGADGWVFNGTYSWTPTACPASPVAVPPNTQYTSPMSNWLNGVVMLEGGFNSMGLTPAQMEAVYSAEIAALPAGSNWLVFEFPPSATWWANEPSYVTNLATINAWWAANYPTHVITVNGQNPTRYLESLSTGSGIDAFDVAHGVPPASTRNYIPDFGALTTNISNTTTCNFSFSNANGQGVEYITVDSENIFLSAQSTSGGVTNVTGCLRGPAFDGSTAATHSSGASVSGTDAVHWSHATRIALAQWAYMSPAVIGALGRLPTAYDVLSWFAHPPSIYALTGSANTFTASQTIAPATNATASANVDSPDFNLVTSVWNSTAGNFENAELSSFLSGNQSDITWLIYPQNTTPPFVTQPNLHVQYDASLTLAPVLPATSSSEAPAPDLTQYGQCWNGTASEPSYWNYQHIISGGLSILEISEDDSCSLTPEIEFADPVLINASAKLESGTSLQNSAGQTLLPAGASQYEGSATGAPFLDGTSGAWTGSSPTPTCGGGTFTGSDISSTVYVAPGPGKRTSFQVVVSVTSADTCTGKITVPLPFSAAAYGPVGCTIYNAGTQYSGNGFISYNGSSVSIAKYDGTTPAVTGNLIVCGQTQSQ